MAMVRELDGSSTMVREPPYSIAWGENGVEKNRVQELASLQLFRTRVLEIHLVGLKAAWIGSALSEFWGWSN